MLTVKLVIKKNKTICLFNKVRRVLIIAAKHKMFVKEANTGILYLLRFS